MNKLLLSLCCLVVTILLSGCVNLEPQPDYSKYYYLSALGTGPDIEQDHKVAKSLGILKLSKVSVPTHLERLQLVERNGDYELIYDTYNRWAEPLDDGVTRALKKQLQFQNPKFLVSSAPEGISVRPDYRLNVNLSEFLYNRKEREVILSGNWSLSTVGGKPQHEGYEFNYHAGVTGRKGPVAWLAAMEGLIERLAQDISERLPQ